MAGRFELVESIPDPPSQDATAGEPAQDEASTASTLLLLALKALSQRAIAAIADLFFLATTISAWWLWWSTPKPDSYQIVSLTIYAAFVLAANWIVRSRRG